MIRNRFKLICISIFIVIMLGSTGYYLLLEGKASFIDCMYMTVISITTVGYGEVIDVTGNVSAQIFTMILIVFGMGIILYGISAFTAMILEGELSGILRKKRMMKKIAQLSNHYIVCGGGETGCPVLVEINKNNEPIVLIEKDDDVIEKCQKAVAGLLYIKGDATDDENLVNAGIKAAAGIIISLPSDKDNLYVTMASRMLNPNIRIISRMMRQKLESKLYKAGADGVVSPNIIGALRLASEMLRPTAVDFLDSMLRSKQGNLRINQLVIPHHSKLIGKTIQDLKLKDQFSLLLLGIRRKDQDIEFDPDDTIEMASETALIVMGEVNHFTSARNWISRTV